MNNEKVSLNILNLSIFVRFAARTWSGIKKAKNQSQKPNGVLQKFREGISHGSISTGFNEGMEIRYIVCLENAGPLENFNEMSY